MPPHGIETPIGTSYELLELLGRGGMGSVWLARKHGALVAFKTMRPDQATDARIRSLFAKEMRLAASIVHPNVARVLEAGEEDGVPYLAMEWIDGCSVRQLTRAFRESSGARDASEGMPLGIALQITADVCAGLHAAHELATPEGVNLGLVHRDVSPHNVIVSRAGAAKLIDFGIAKVQSAVTGDTTSSSGIKGKIRYMAPEQARGQAVDRRADVFALGAMLFELVTGAPPFEGPNDLAILHQLLDAAPREIPASVPAPVADLLRRAIAKKARDRFPTAAAMREAVLAALAELDPRIGPPTVARLVALACPPRPSVATAKTLEPAKTAKALEPETTTISATRFAKKRVFAFTAGTALALVGGAFLAGRGGAFAASPPATVDVITEVAAAEPPRAEPEVALDLPATEPRREEAKPKVSARVPVGPGKKAARAAPDDLTTSLRDRR